MGVPGSITAHFKLHTHESAPVEFISMIENIWPGRDDHGQTLELIERCQKAPEKRSLKCRST